MARSHILVKAMVATGWHAYVCKGLGECSLWTKPWYVLDGMLSSAKSLLKALSCHLYNRLQVALEYSGTLGQAIFGSVRFTSVARRKL